MRNIPVVIAAIISVLFAWSPVLWAETNFKTFEELSRLHSPYKASLNQLYEANVKFKLNLTDVLNNSGSLVFVDGRPETINLDPDTKDRFDKEEILRRAKELERKITIEGKGFCKITLFSPMPDTDKAVVSDLSNDALWSLQSFKQITSSASSKTDPTEFELLLDNGYNNQTLTFAKISCTRPNPLVDKAFQSMGAPLSEIEILKSSLGKNIQILVDAKDMSFVLMSE